MSIDDSADEWPAKEEATGQISRRRILGAIVLAMAGVEVATKESISFDEIVEYLRASSQEKHGGVWGATVSSDFILIAQRTT